MNKMSLFGLLDSYSILIPSLQRNYVHGRDDAHAKEVREHFVRLLDECCVNGGEMNLDVVYGVLRDNKILIPIDGQQRLTTLWLSAVYAVSMSKDGTSRMDTLSKLSRFSYESRPLASTFCRWLTSGVNINYDTALHQAEDCWGEDPTVRAMITTLRLIHGTFSEKTDALLTVLLGDMVHFEFSEVNGEDSDLYVKINARGRQLTQWENFKGAFASSLTNARKDFEREIESLSDKYFEVFKKIPDNAFFSLFGRIADYVLRNEEQYASDKHENLSILAHGDDCYVPVEEFALESIAARIVAPILRMLRWALSSDNNVKLWYWESGEASVAKTLLAPKNNNDRDFALFLFEYFTKNEGGCGLCKDQHRSLRLVANILENVDRGRLMRYDEVGYGPENQFNRIKYLKELLEKSDNLYDAQYEFSDSAPMQLNEEVAKGEIYREGVSDQIKLLQKCESFMHGRVRIALLATNNQNGEWTSIAEREQQQSRLAALKKHLEEWYSNDDEQARIGFLKHIISCEPWNLIDQIMLSTKDDALRYLLSTRDDVYLQKTYLDNLTDESWGKEHHPWQRDWRKNVFEVKDWKDRVVKWHGGTRVYFLYENTYITNAMPIADWRFEVREKIKEAFGKAGIGEVDSIRSNDQGTRCVISKLSDGRIVNIYLCKDGVWIRKQGSNGLGSPEQIIPINDPELKFDAFTLANKITKVL